jgi:phage-related tail protein
MLAGSGIKLDFFDKSGNFKGVENMVAQLDKLKKLDPVRMNAALKELTGGGQDQGMLAQIITNGMEGYKKTVADMEAQADLQRRVNAMLGTLASAWEAASGTFTNAMAAFSETFAPELKTLTLWFGNLSESLQDFIKTHPILAKWIGIAVAGFSLAAIGAGALAIAFAAVLKYISLISTLGPIAIGFISGLAKVFRVLGTVLMFVGRVILIVGRAMLLNPIGLAITAIAGGAFLIYKYWEPIKGFFKNLWSGIVDGFKTAIKAISSIMPDWMKSNSSGTTRFTNLQKPAPTIGNNNNRLNGTLHVKIDSEGRAIATIKTNQNGVKINMSNGPHMVSQ